MDPVKPIITACIVPSLPEYRDAALGRLEIRIELVVDVLGWMNVGDRTLFGIRFCCDLNLITTAIPVGALSTCC